MDSITSKPTVRIVFALIFFLIPMGTVFTSCSDTSNQNEAEPNTTVKLAYANWAEGVAITHLTAVLLEDKLGYQVETKMAPVKEVFKLIGSGEYDLFMDAWLPRTHASYLSQHEDRLVDLGVVFDGARTGLVVPDYLNLNSIAELDRISNQVNSTIIGIESSAGIMKASQNLSSGYSLQDWQIRATSGQAMTDSLQQAILRRDPIVITGWVPHWMWAEFNLKFLEDPENIYGDDERIHALGVSNLADQHPRIATLIDRMSLNRVQLADLMDEIRLSEAIPMKTARQWVNENPEIVNEWIRGLQPEREKVM
jgi:glycine betaine/proline transport system substrate-binding protein